MFAFLCFHDKRVYTRLRFDYAEKLKISRAALLVGLILNRPMKWALILNLLFFKVISDLEGQFANLALGRRGMKKIYSLEFTFKLTLIQKHPLLKNNVNECGQRKR